MEELQAAQINLDGAPGVTISKTRKVCLEFLWSQVVWASSEEAGYTS